MSDTQPVLRVAGLRLEADTSEGPRDIVTQVDLEVSPGEIVGVVGESGSGKSMTANAIMRLQPANVRIAGGSIEFEGREIVNLTEREMIALRGRGIGMIFQDPTSFLNPIATVGGQIVEAVPRDHEGDRTERVRELLRLVGLSPDLATRTTYPHELSGGMKQRALIAMALAGNPRLLIADEPTTALDVTVQAQILSLLKDLRDRLGMGLLLITHDLGVMRHMCDRTYVMYQGATIESGDTDAIIERPRHPYTRSLIAATADHDLDAELAHNAAAPEDAGGPRDPIVDVSGLVKVYTLPRTRLFSKPDTLRASNGVDLTIARGESVALIGESGSGKSTIGQILLGLTDPTEGTVLVGGREVAGLRGRTAHAFRREVQMIFQNPYSSLNPIKSIGHTLRQPFLTHGVCGPAEAHTRAKELLSLVELPENYVDRYPHQLSGGERQRVAIARAMSLKPKLVVADEPVSALDMSIRGQILSLLKKFRELDGVSFLLITHDLSDAALLTDRVVVLYLGEVVEEGPSHEVLSRPRHPYTQALLAATLPVHGPRREEIVIDAALPGSAT